MPALTQVTDAVSGGIRYAYATGAAAIDHWLNVSYAVEVLSVELHAGGALGAGSISCTRNSALGASYDAVLHTEDLVGDTDFFWQPTRPIPLGVTDRLDIALANGGGETWGLVVFFRAL